MQYISAILKFGVWGLLALVFAGVCQLITTYIVMKLNKNRNEVVVENKLLGFIIHTK